MKIKASDNMTLVNIDKDQFVEKKGYTYAIVGDRRILKLDTVTQLEDWEVDNAKEAVYLKTEGKTDIYIATYGDQEVEIHVARNEIGVD